VYDVCVTIIVVVVVVVVRISCSGFSSSSSSVNTTLNVPGATRGRGQSFARTVPQFPRRPDARGPQAPSTTVRKTKVPRSHLLDTFF